MYCCHCANEIDEAKVESERSSYDPDVEIKEDTGIAYVCPRCGHLIHHDVSEEEIKSLSQAAHAQIQRARNSFASGMGMLSIGGIALILAIIFFRLACKPSNQYQLVPTCAEFYVSILLGVAAVTLLVWGGVLVLLGHKRSKKNEALLQDINNRTFVQ